MTKGGETKNKYKEYHSKQASIHTVAVVNRGGWNGVKQQNQRADSAEKKRERSKCSVNFQRQLLLPPSSLM